MQFVMIGGAPKVMTAQPPARIRLLPADDHGSRSPQPITEMSKAPTAMSRATNGYSPRVPT